jgi:hypothetical protein
MAYALILGDQAIEIAPGEGFTGVEGLQYPGDWPAWSPQKKVAAGLRIIAEPGPPAAGARRVSTALALVDGAPVRVATDEVIPLAELKAAKLAAAEAAYQAHRQSPFHWDFGAVETLDDFGVGQGPAGAQTLQMRDTPEQDDLKNWGFAFNAALAAAVAGAPQTLVPLKTSANVWVQTTAAQAMQVLMTGDGTQQPAFARGVAMLAAYGLKKAEIGAAADAEALAGVDVEAGWPG